MFARERNALIYQGGLDNGHWIHSMIRNLDDEELTIELVNETHGALFRRRLGFCFLFVFVMPIVSRLAMM